MRNTRLNELQAEIKLGGRNINNLSYLNDTTLMVESKEDLKNLLISVKEESERAGLKLNIKKKKKNKIMVSSPITSCQIEGENVEVVTGFKVTADGDCSHEIRRCLLLGRKTMTKLDSVLKSRDITVPTKSA